MEYISIAAIVIIFSFGYALGYIRGRWPKVIVKRRVELPTAITDYQRGRNESL